MPKRRNIIFPMVALSAVFVAAYTVRFSINSIVKSHDDSSEPDLITVTFPVDFSQIETSYVSIFDGTTTTAKDVTTTAAPATTIYSTTSAVTSTETTTTTKSTTTTVVQTMSKRLTTSIAKATKTTTTAINIEKANASPQNNSSSSKGLTCLGTFKGTYYAGKTAPCKGGSGRTLINCSTGGSGIKGSVASRYIYSKYGYKKNGRTKVWIECSGMPSMTGWYYVDDCCGATNVIDFYYYKNANCPFRNSGVISVKVYI